MRIWTGLLRSIADRNFKKSSAEIHPAPVRKKQRIRRGFSPLCCGKNIRSKSGENPVFIKVLPLFAVEKKVENVKTSPENRGKFPKISQFYTAAGEKHGGKVEESVENPALWEKHAKFCTFSPKLLTNRKKHGFLHAFGRAI
ncbi:MAG: hypothetical protein IJ518_04720 [Clostridia bacterium]|nr:hypothetical protein [Clostridia bacterium]